MHQRSLPTPPSSTASISTISFALIDDVKREPAKARRTGMSSRPGTARRGAAQKLRVMSGRRAGVTPVLDRHRRAPRARRIDHFANPQEHLIAALNACMIVGYVAQCAVRGITLESLSIETDGDIDLRGFLGIDPAVPPGYETLSYTVRIKGRGTEEQFAEVHEAVMATSPNFYNLSRPVALEPVLIVE